MIWRFLDNKKERDDSATRTCIIIFPGYQKSSPFWRVNRSPLAYLTCHELAARGQWELDVMLVLKPLHHFCSHASQCWLSRVQLAIQPARHGRPWTILTISLQTTSRSQHCKNNCWQGEIMLLRSFLQCQYKRICHKGVQVSGKTKHKPTATGVCLCSRHANVICNSSQIASWPLG